MKKTVLFSIFVLALASCRNSEKYDATGLFEATTVTVSAETSGKLVSFAVDEGDSLEIGQQVGLVDTTLLVLQRKQLHSQQLSTEKSSPDIAAQAAALRSQIAHQQNECDRIARLLANGAATQKQSDDANAGLRTLRGQLEGLLSTLDKNRSSITESASALQYQKEQVEEQIRKSRIIAPITGTVLQKYAEQGEYATPGRPLFKMANLNDIYLRCYFTASQLAHIRIGQEVTVIADFGGNEQYEYAGKIIWIAQESEFTPKSIQTQDSRSNLVYAVKVAVKNDGRLKLGQYGEVRL
ncbi:MAG TPA: HlyD family efflux transporter periplasmic adaptor subunit [Candidatus Phocaeicola excrementigallinarum]|nr:HlyD family efflux transporter periplasmic adaptor subunit [Candidatus Phocaeicola excrementigallinarum]